MNNNRYTGILLHISSLNGDFGIGTFGKEAYKFVDFLKSSNTKLWQILPLNPTDVNNSPFQCFSAFAGNYMFIDLYQLKEEGLLSDEDLINYKNNFIDTNKIDYNLVSKSKLLLLYRAFQQFNSNKNKSNEYYQFIDENKFWLYNYTLFSGLRHFHSNSSFFNWDKKYKFNNSLILENIDNEIFHQIQFNQFLQYIFFKQWNSLKKYANSNNVQIVGDIPIYVSYNSADVWANKELFLLNDDFSLAKMAGVPPDYFSELGQLWGNPIYNWTKLKDTNYQWWVKRFEFGFKLYDFIRIDHFRAFSEFWSIEANSQTAINGKWQHANGEELFDILKNKFDLSRIFAEDLGIIDQKVENLRDKYNLIGMKILQFAFNNNENNKYLPHNYEKNCLVYSGTHDNNTIKGWFDNADIDEKNRVLNYLNCEEKDIVWSLIRTAISSVANYSIIPMQDFLELDENSRMNIPGTTFNNWVWKMTDNQLNEQLALKIKNLNETYFRN